MTLAPASYFDLLPGGLREEIAKFYEAADSKFCNTAFHKKEIALDRLHYHAKRGIKALDHINWAYCTSALSESKKSKRLELFRRAKHFARETDRRINRRVSIQVRAVTAHRTRLYMYRRFPVYTFMSGIKSSGLGWD